MAVQSGLVVHLLYRFEFGGVQTLLAECIKRMDGNGIRHVVICLADADPSAVDMLGDVELLVLNRHTLGAWHAHRVLFMTLRRLKPTVLHTYNISTLEYALTGLLAGVPRRIHAEHGRGVDERLGKHRKYNFLRYAMAPLIETFITVSDDLAVWLSRTVGISGKKIKVIRNGIDIDRFRPQAPVAQLAGASFVIGTIGRLDAIKAQSDLIDAYILLRARLCDHAPALSLVIVGEGPLKNALEEKIRAAGLNDSVTMAGVAADVTALLNSFTVFVLPSLSEALPITLLEAMASGIPVVATNVGGIPGLIGDDLHGTLVSVSDPVMLADAIARYISAPLLRSQHAGAARRFVVTKHNIQTTAMAYAALYAAAPALLFQN